MDDSKWARYAALGGLAMGAALALASGAISSTVALQHRDVGEGAKFFYVLTAVLIAMAGFGLVVHIVRSRRSRTVRRSSRRGSTSSAGSRRCSS